MRSRFIILLGILLAAGLFFIPSPANADTPRGVSEPEFYATELGERKSSVEARYDVEPLWGDREGPNVISRTYRGVYHESSPGFNHLVTVWYGDLDNNGTWKTIPRPYSWYAYKFVSGEHIKYLYPCGVWPC